MIVYVWALLVLTGQPGEELLDEISGRYSLSDGIQWEIESVVYSEIFEEYDTTIIDFEYFPPDTFSISSEMEKIAGIGDTIWVMSKRHKQIQKKLTDGSIMPYNFILNWADNYDLLNYINNDKMISFYLKSKGGVVPEELNLGADKSLRIKMVKYEDSKGDNVFMSFKKEKLKRPQGFDDFYRTLPEDYDFIDLTE